jgi:hypothetical protein
VAYTSLLKDEGDSTFSGFELPEADCTALIERLADLPGVSENEYWAPSTRLEVLDIAVDALLAKRARDPVRTRPYGPDDYE